MTIVEFDFKGHRKEGELVKENALTVVVRIRHAGKTFHIKRHKSKHRVGFMEARNESSKEEAT